MDNGAGLRSDGQEQKCLERQGIFASPLPNGAHYHLILGGCSFATAASAARSAKRATASNTTTNHDEIKKWVESRGGFPAHVRQTGRKRGDLGVLRIDYPGYSGKDTLERVDWDEWFAAFDRNKLAFLHDKKRNSRFSKLVNR